MRTEQEPEVSILLPYHNRTDLTRDCLLSLEAQTRDVRWELILIDDASTESLPPGWWDADPRVRILRQEERASYSINNNRAAAQARGNYLCLLNNDTLLKPGWLSALLRAAKAHPDLGVMGNLHLYADGKTVQHAGMAFSPEGMPLHLQPGISQYHPSLCAEREFQCVTFACVLIPRARYEELGGLDESYRNGFEDCDFCLRAREAGYPVRFTPASRIIHFGQSTPGRCDHDAENEQHFRSRWQGKVELDLHIKEAENQRANTRPSPAGEEGLHLALDASRPNAFLWAGAELLQALQRSGLPLSVPAQASIHPSLSPEQRKLIRSLSRQPEKRQFQVKWTHYWEEELCQSLRGDVEAELFCTNYRYPGPERSPDNWMNHLQRNHHYKLPLARYNLDALREWNLPEARCRILPLGYAPEILKRYPGLEAPRREPQEELQILLVTNSHDLPRYGSDLAIEALARAFGRKDPVHVHIRDYGAASGNAELKRWVAAHPDFPKHSWHENFLSKEELMDLYARMDLQLAPFRGEGYSMKILDAAAIGLPTLMPAYGGPMEYCRPGTFFPLPFQEVPVRAGYDAQHTSLGRGATWCEVSLEAMVEELRRLHQDRDALRRCGEQALQYVRPRFSWDQTAATLLEALQGWEAGRLSQVCHRMSPNSHPLSVILPTRDRPEHLERTLQAYSTQTLPRDEFDLHLINDHGNPESFRDLEQRYPSLKLHLHHNHSGSEGPGAARNLGLQASRGDLVLITGDDIIPQPDFLEQHVQAHKRHPRLQDACLGLSDWHPDLGEDPFLDYIVGPGGQQFKTQDLRAGKQAPFDRLYTSNCSLKRCFLNWQDPLFSEHYRFAAYEDVELGYRLHQRGMRLYYEPAAHALHLHEINVDSFLARQRRCGRMLSVLAWQHPDYVPREHRCFLEALEQLRRAQQPQPLQEALQPLDPESLLNELQLRFTQSLKLGRELQQETAPDLRNWGEYLEKRSSRIWEALNQLSLRLGMAEEWADQQGGCEQAAAWVQLLQLPSLLDYQGPDWELPQSRPAALRSFAPNSRLVYETARFLRHLPLLGTRIQRFEHSPRGQALRKRIARLISD